MAKSLSIKEFFGLMTGVNEPQPGHAQKLVNFITSRFPGRLMVEDGVSVVAYTPTAPTGTSSFVARKVKQFFVPDHGGKAITAVLASFTQQYSVDTGLTGASTLGLFVRPYWNGSAWTDSWTNLSSWIRVRSNGTTGPAYRLYLRDFPATHQTLIDSDALAGWYAVLTNFQADRNHLLITASQYNGGSPYVEFQADVDLANFTEFSTAALEFYCFKYPAADGIISGYATTRLWNQLDELRLTTGTAGKRMGAWFRTKTFSVTGRTTAIDKLLFGRADMNLDDKAVAVSSVSRAYSATEPLPEGTYELALSVENDDGQQTELIDQSATVATTPLQSQPLAGVNGNHYYGNAVIAEGHLFTISGYQTVTAVNLSSGTKHTFTPPPPSIGENWPFQGLMYTGGYVLAVYGISDMTSSAQACQLVIDPQTMIMESTPRFMGNIQYAFAPYDFFGAQTILDDLNGFSIGAFRASTGNWYINAYSGPGVEAHQGASATNLTGNPFSNWYQGSGFKYQDIGYVPLVYLTSSYVLKVTTSGVNGATAPGFLQKQINTTYFDGTTNRLVSIVGDGTTAFYLREDGNVYTNAFANLGNATPIAPALLVATGVSSAKRILIQNDLLVVVGDGTTKVYTKAGVLQYTDSSTAGVRDGVAMGSYDVLLSSYGDNELEKIVLGGDGTLSSDGTLNFTHNLLVSPALLQDRAKNVCVWLRKDGEGDYALVKKIPLDSTEAFDAATVWNSTLKHQYAEKTTDVTLLGSDWSDTYGDAISYIGRDTADSGNLDAAGVAIGGNTAYAFGCTTGGKVQRNKLFRSTASGDGAPQFDVFPNDASYIVDVEFNDGDKIVAVGTMIDRLLVLKRRSLVLLTPTSEGGFLRDAVPAGTGTMSDLTLQKIGEQLYWLASDGFYRFSTSGLEPISVGIRPTLDVFTDAEKAAAFSWVDPKNLDYYTQIAATTYVFHAPTGEWRQWDTNSTNWADACEDTNDDPAARPLARYLALYDDSIYRPDPQSNEVVGEGDIYYSFKTAEIRPQGSGAFDFLLLGLSIETNISGAYATIYDENGTQVEQVQLTSNIIRNLKTGMKLRSFSIEVWGYLSDRSLVYTLKQLNVFFELIPATGLNQTTYVPGD